MPFVTYREWLLASPEERAADLRAEMAAQGCQTVEEFAHKHGVPIKRMEDWLTGRYALPKQAVVAINVARDLRANPPGAADDGAVQQ